MSKWFEPELRNDFDFIFSKVEDGEKVWYRTYVYADEYAFKYSERTFQKEMYYTRYLKPNYSHEIIGKVYVLEDYYEDNFSVRSGENTEYSGYNQIIHFKTNEHGEIDLESVEFHDY